MKQFKTYLILSCIALTSFCKGQGFYEKGYSEYLNENYTKSIELLSLAIENNDETAMAYMYRGVSKGYSNDFYHAMEDLNNSKKIDSTNYKLYHLYGKVYALSGFFDTSLEYMDKAISMNEKDGDLFDSRGLVKMSLNKFEEAVLDLNISIQINPKKDNYYVNRGFIYFLLNDYDSAINDYNVAIRIKKSHKAFVNRGFAYYRQSLFIKAINDFDVALKLFPEDYETYYLRGSSYRKLREFDKACLDFKKSAEFNYSLAKEELKNNCTN